MPILELVQEYFATTPPEELGAHFLWVIAPFLIFSVLIWGFSEVWIHMKQNQYWAKLQWDLLAVSVPADAIQSPKGMENFFNNLSGSKSSITKKEEWIYGKFQAYFGFEIVSNGGEITFYMRCVKKYRDLVEAALYAQYPEARIVEMEEYVDVIPDDYPNEDYDVFGSEVSMRKDNIFPLKTYDMFEHQGEQDQRFKDPLLPLFEIMGKMRPGEHYWFQILIMSPDSQDWRKAGEKFIKEKYGVAPKAKKGWISENVAWLPKGIMEQTVGMAFGGGGDDQKSDDFRMFKITPDERDLLDAVAKKCSEIGWYTKIRFVYAAKKEVFRKGTIASMTKGILNQYDSGWNKIGLTGSSTPKDDYIWQEWSMTKRQRLLVSKYKNRSFGAGATPFILTSSELATFFHFPSADARTPVLTSLGSRLGEAPQELTFAMDEGDDVLPSFAPSGSSPTDAAPQPPSKHAVEAQRKEGFNEPVEMVVPKPTPLVDDGGRTQQHASRQDVASESAPQEVVSSESSELVEQEDAPAFSEGMPAPLPPGLDLNDEPIDERNAPQNLPR